MSYRLSAPRNRLVIDDSTFPKEGIPGSADNPGKSASTRTTCATRSTVVESRRYHRILLRSNNNAHSKRHTG